VLEPPTHNVDAPAVNAGVATFAGTVTGKSAVAGFPQTPVAVARTVKLAVTLLITPVVGLIEAPPVKMLYAMPVELVAVAV
jgi:hypothetical protein